MKRMIHGLALIFVLSVLVGCGSTHEAVRPEARPAAARSDVHIRVADVSNDTRELFDVDAIGLLWNGLNESLKARNLLWTPEIQEPPLTLQAHIVRYQKGNVIARNLLPGFGKTLLVVRCDVKQGDQVVATVEVKNSISIGSEGFTLGAWRKIFAKTSEDVVNELVKKL